MKHISTVLGQLLVITLLWLGAAAGCNQRVAEPTSRQIAPKVEESPLTETAPEPKKLVSKELDSATVEAWRKAGAKVGWYGEKPTGYWEFTETKPTEYAALPAFRWYELKPGAIAKLPAPAEPFSLHLENSDISDVKLLEFAGFKNLQVLDLSNRIISDEALKVIAGFPNLQILILFNVKGVTDAGLKELANLNNLQSLNLFSTNVTDAGLKEIAAVKSLQTLDLARTKITDKGLKELAGLKNLRTLDVGNTKVTQAGELELFNANSNLRIVR